MPARSYELRGIRIFECAAEGPELRSDRDAVDLMSEARGQGANLIVIPVERLGDDFFRLETRIAGEVIQRFAMYRVRVAIIGDISRHVAESKSLRDFVYESNRGNQCWFVNREELDKRLERWQNNAQYSHGSPPSVVTDVRAALKEGMAQLRAHDVPSYTLAAELLLMHALDRDRTWLYTHPEAELDASAAREYFALIARRAAGEPTQYLTGKQEFWGLEFEVNPSVLIPRPETEHVVEVALERLGARGIKINMRTGEPSPPLRIADVGTGSGCLTVALAHELPHAEIFATDISAAAIDVARRNAARYRVSSRVHFFQGNLLEPVLQAAGSLDLIVSNPPYVAQNEAPTLAREVREHEPHAALFGGPSGVEMYDRLIKQAGELLRSGGVLVLEMGYNSAQHVRAILVEQHNWVNVSVTNDLAGIPRVIAAERA